MNILTKYPYLADEDPNGYAEPGETWLYSVPKGWQQMFLNTLDEINEILERARIPKKAIIFLQIKEKFGALRIYWGVRDEFEISEQQYKQISTLFDAAENTSEMLCAFCGQPATLHSQGWILPYCYTCAEQSNKEANERHKTNYAVENCFTKIRKERTNA